MTAETGMPSICFVALNAYNVVSGREDLGHIGGAEVQQALIAQELARRGYHVSFVTRDLGQADGIEHHGIRVFKTCAEDDGLPGIRFVHPRWTSLCKAMRRADADIYYQRTGGLETGQVAGWCRGRDRRFVFAAATSHDCDRSLLHIRDLRSRMLYRRGLRSADRVIVQSHEQRRALTAEFDIASQVIRSCAALPADESTATPAPDGKLRMLWLGRFSQEKGLDRLLELARLCPACEFDVLGDGSEGSPLVRSIRQQAEQLSNVHLRGRVPHGQVDSYYRRASFVVCTSHFEGFPNTFVEAWARGIPVISTVDPDRLIMRHKLGFASADLQELAGVMGRANRAGDEFQAWSSNARRFYAEHHTPAIVVDDYEKLIRGLAARHATVDGDGGMAPAKTI